MCFQQMTATHIQHQQQAHNQQPITLQLPKIDNDNDNNHSQYKRRRK